MILCLSIWANVLVAQYRHSWPDKNAQSLRVELIWLDLGDRACAFLVHMWPQERWRRLTVSESLSTSVMLLSGDFSVTSLKCSSVEVSAGSSSNRLIVDLELAVSESSLEISLGRLPFWLASLTAVLLFSEYGSRTSVNWPRRSIIAPNPAIDSNYNT